VDDAGTRTSVPARDTRGPTASGRHRRGGDDAAERQATYREVFAVPEFRALWIAHTLSLLGDQLSRVALSVLVFHQSHSALLTGVTYALTYLPPLIGGPLLSGLADIVPRRRLMIICDVARAVLIAAIAIPGLPFLVLCALLFLAVLCGSPFSAARSAMMPDVLEGDKYVIGNAITNITMQGAQMIGFVAAGATVALIGTHWALFVDGVTFLVSALFVLVGVRERPLPPREDDGDPSFWEVIRGGTKIVFGDPRLRALVLFAWLCGFVVVPEGLAAPYAAEFDNRPLTVGLLMAAMPTGMTIGGFLYTRFVKPTSRIRVMGWLAMWACAPMIVSVLHPPLWVVFVVWAVGGAGSAYQLAANAAFVLIVPPRSRGLAFGLVQSGMQAVQGLAIAAAGALADVLGPELVVGLSGAAGLVVATALAMAWSRIRGDIIAQMRETAEQRSADQASAAEAETVTDPGSAPG
jgi:MFS family permease